jgi:ribosomal protein S18 acetylase RimI-like enzyme
MVELTVTYLEMTKPPEGVALSCTIAGATVRRETLPPATYLTIWRSVGEPLRWDQRSRMSLSDLQEILSSPTTHVYILRLDGLPKGLCEFEGVGQANVELTNFGLIPEAQGQRLGPYLLDHALREIWAYPTQRIWLHTDTWDHPKAIAIYQRAGFDIYKRNQEHVPD